MQKEIEIIANSPISFRKNFMELLEYRGLVVELCKRDLKSRYAQTFLGFAWSLLNPLISVLLLFFVFGVIVKTDTHGIPALLFVMCGLCVWNFFSRVVGDSSQSLLGAQTVVKRIYFPRIIIPISKAIIGLVDLMIVLVLLFILLLYYRYPISWSILWVIPLCAGIVASSLAFGIWVSALSIRFRDFNQIVPIALRIGMFISPIGYGLAAVPAQYHWWYQINPLTGFIEGFRSAVLGTPYTPEVLWYAILVSLVLLVTGIHYFFRMDKYIGDIL
jgi:lipopolysaccharide transport system permease protein